MFTELSNPPSNDQNSSSRSQTDLQKKQLPSLPRQLSLKVIVGILFLFLLLVGGGAGLYLMRMSQDVRQQAYSGACAAGSCVGGKKCEYDPTTGGGYIGNQNCTDGVTCSSSGMKPVDTGKGCCSGLAIDATGRCMAVVATPSPSSSCDPKTHCCNPKGCSYQYTTYTKK